MGVANSEGVLTLGQVSEIFFLLLVPWFFRQLGVKNASDWNGFLGIAICTLCRGEFRSASFSLFGVLFHGICYDFFFVTGQLYVDKVAPDDIRSSAQGFIAFVTLGAGMFIGGILNGWWNGKQTIDGSLDWVSVWYFPATLAAVVLVIFFLLFKQPEEEKE